VGPAVVWSWLAVVTGQGMVALVLAELATLYPVSGYGYQWTSRLLSPHWGFAVGWLLLLQFLTGFPGVCATFADVLRMGWDVPVANGTLTVLVILGVTLIHVGGIRLATWLNDAGVIAELAGVGVILFLFLVVFGPSSPHGPSFLVNTTQHPSGLPAHAGSWALSLLMGAWCLTGFEAAADLAEETRRPRRVIPRAMLGSLLAAGTSGFLMLAGFMLAIEDLGAVQAAEHPLVALLRGRLGALGLRLVLGIVMVSILACAVASMAATSRLMFSMARDRMLPGSGVLGWVHPGSRVPIATLVAVGVASAAVVLLLDNLALITSVSATAGYLGYAGILAALLLTRRPPEPAPGEFTLGRAGRLVRWLALAWTLGVVAALAIPDTGDGWLAARATGIALAAGLLLYLSCTRGRIQRGEAGLPGTGSDGPATPNGP
jgi:amino acid transporter